MQLEYSKSASLLLHFFSCCCCGQPDFSQCTHVVCSQHCGASAQIQLVSLQSQLLSVSRCVSSRRAVRARRLRIRERFPYIVCCEVNKPKQKSCIFLAEYKKSKRIKKYIKIIIVCEWAHEFACQFGRRRETRAISRKFEKKYFEKYSEVICVQSN